MVVLPHWPTQAWYSLLMQLCVSPPVFLRRNRKTLTMPHDPEAVHASSAQDFAVDCVPLIRQSLSSRGISSKAADIIQSSWRT